MTQGLVLYDASARIVVCNQRYIDMYGLSTDVVKAGLPLSATSSGIARKRDPSTGMSSSFVRTSCGTSHRAESLKPSWNPPTAVRFMFVNKPLAQGGWVATIEDITERRNLEQERDRNYAFLRQIIDHIPTQITVKDVRDRRYVLANRVAETQFGLPRDAIVGKTALDLFPKEAADIIAADDERALQSADGLFLDDRPWQSQGLGQRYITSKRIGIPDQTGEIRDTSSTSSTMSPSGGAPTRRSRTSRITTR